MHWTPSQLAAIQSDNSTLLISAAAGSGKTAVLVERVGRLCRETDITRMLIVTFTRAAAAEMRERISKFFNDSEEEVLLKQIFSLSRAQISTIHNFCTKVLRQHFHLLGIDPMFRVGNEIQLGMLREQAMDEAIEEVCAEENAECMDLIEWFSDETVVELVKQMHRFLMAMPDPWAWGETVLLKEKTACDEEEIKKQLFFESQLLLSCILPLLEEQRTLLMEVGAPLRYLENLEKDETYVQHILHQVMENKVPSDEGGFSALSRKRAPEGENAELTAKFKANRDLIKTIVKKALLALPTGEDDPKVVAECRTILNGVFQLTKRYHDRYCQLKNSMDLVDYNDLEHFCYALLCDPNVCKEVAGNFDYIFVDEYQDVSQIQEHIIQRIHQGNKLFLVGDVKQSIYRFRLADPSLFIDKYKRFSIETTAEERKILLGMNFRSAKNVIDSVNHVFKHVMQENITEIEYDEEAMLYAPDTAKKGGESELVLLHHQAEENSKEKLRQGFQYEALYIAKRIRDMVGTYTVAQQGNRPLQYRDIAILVRNASSHGNIITNILHQEGIPVYSEADGEYYELPEISDMINILHVLDNPFQDIPLLGVLRIPYFGFTENELATLRLAQTDYSDSISHIFNKMQPDTPFGERVVKVRETIDFWRYFSRHSTVEETIKMILDDTGIYMLAGTWEDGDIRQANLRLLAEKAAQNPELKLRAFLENVHINIKNDDSRTAKTLSDSEDVVRLMTMHKSKGLEFPVVFLMELGGEFRGNASEIMDLDTELGGNIQHIDLEKKVKKFTLLSRAVKAKNYRKRTSEEARILYVAMTRAKEKLIMVASTKDLTSQYEVWAMQGESGLPQAKSMLHWIGQSLHPYLGETLPIYDSLPFTTSNGASFIYREVEAHDYIATENALDDYIPELDLTPLTEEGIAYLHQTFPKVILAKTSVTSLIHNGKLQSEEEETPTHKRIVQEALKEFPDFMTEEKISPAQRGTAIHKVLGQLDYGKPMETQAIQSTIDWMKRKGLINLMEAEIIKTSDIAQFFHTDLGKRALRSPFIKQEWSFSMQMEENFIVQGVLDLCFLENDAWVLVDYKTDHCQNLNELKERYHQQMLWYANALEKITHKSVKNLYLYSIYHDAFIELEMGTMQKLIPVSVFDR